MSSDPPRRPELTAEQWDERYRAAPSVWTPEPNAPLVEFAAGLTPGRALDIGAGEGRNAVWLATRGWSVTAIDLSAVGLERAAERAAAQDVRLECVVGDWHDHPFGAAAFELVVVSYMHPAPRDRGWLFRRAREALVPGGHLFTVGVFRADHGRRGPPDSERLYTPMDLVMSLSAFQVLRCQKHTYEQEHSSGRREVTDVVAIARRPD